MTHADRLLLTEQLERENAAAKARIAERRAAREADPFAFEVVADARLTQDPGDLCFGEPVQKVRNG